MVEPGSLFWLFLLLLVTPSVFSDVVGQDVHATAGDDIVLSCLLDPPQNVTDQTVKWTLNGVTVHVYRDRTENPDDLQDEQFRGRTSLFPDELVRGNISLKLSNVHEEDAGLYSCSVPGQKSHVKRGNVFLTVQVSDVVGHEPVQVEVGDDVVLSCHLEPQLDVTDQMVEWTWNNRTVHRYRDGADDYEDQDEQFRGRTSMFHHELVKGDISLKLTSVNKEDEGVYSCHVPRLKSLIKEGSVSLKVGGDLLDKMLIFFCIVIPICIVLTSAKVFLLIMKRIRGDPLDPMLIVRSVLGVLFIIAVSTLLYLYINGDPLDTMLIFLSVLTPLFIVFTTVKVFLLIRKRIRGDPLDIVGIISCVWGLLSIITVSALLSLYIRRERLDTMVIIFSVWGVLFIIVASAEMFFKIKRWRREKKKKKENNQKRDQLNPEEMNRLQSVPG